MELYKNKELFISTIQEASKALNINEALIEKDYFVMLVLKELKKEKDTEQRIIRIIEGRHPVVEKVINNSEYISNDIIMDEKTNILLITGPNMAGKSTYMRQMAIITIMAQIGCFVPAKQAELPIFDAIYTRIGASDDPCLHSGVHTARVSALRL